jgi:Fic family protein
VISCPSYKPLILSRSQDIAHELGLLAGQKIDLIPVKLRRANNIKTIQASLAIEGNTLDEIQVTSLFEGNRILGPEKDIMEVKNAIKVYSDLGQVDSLSIEDLLMVHENLMAGLVPENGKWRIGG